MKIAFTFTMVGIAAAVVSIVFAGHEGAKRRSHFVDLEFDYALGIGSRPLPLVLPWYIEQPYVLGVAVLVGFVVIGLLLGILRNLER